MSEVKIKENTEDINSLKVALQELGIVSNAYGKSAGLVEKQVSKMQAGFHKTPIVQLGKQFRGFGQQLKKLAVTVNEHVEQSEEENIQQKKSMTVMTRLGLQMLLLTKFGKDMGKMTKANTAGWYRLTRAMFGIMSIFMIIGIAIGILSIAFQGAESPLLEYTDGIWGLDEGLQGLIMVMTGEGEGGVLGAINVIVAAIIIALPFVVLFGLKWAALAAAITLVVGVYQLVNKETGDSDVAMAAAVITVVALAGAYMMLKGALVVASTAGMGLSNSLLFAAGVAVIAVALIAGGILGLYLFATGKVTGWMGWALAAVSAFAIGVGVAILIGFTWPLVLLVAAIVLFVAIVYKYKDEIMYDLGRFGDWIMKGVDKGIEKLVTGCAYLVAFVLSIISIVVGVFMFASHAILGVIAFPFIFIGKFVAGLWKDWKESGKSGWRGFLSWVKGVGPTLGAIAKTAAKDAFNTVIKLYNDFAKVFKVKVPSWVTKATGVGDFTIPQIPKLAKGGIVNSPTLAMIGEDGPEAVVPLTKKNNPNGIGLGGGGNNITINVNASGITDRSDKRALAREIGEAIREEMSRGGRSHGGRRGAL